MTSTMFGTSGSSGTTTLDVEARADDGPIGWAATLRDVILGGQDGLVNVLGLVLGMAAATGDARVIVTAGLAATLAESIAMAGVAYTASGAEAGWVDRRWLTIRVQVEGRAQERARVRAAAIRSLGLSDAQAAAAEEALTADDAAWLAELEAQRTALAPVRETRPVRAALVVGLSTLVGSAVPLGPFLVLPPATAAPIALISAMIVLAAAGALRARAGGTSLRRAAAEMVAIGSLSALAGYAIGVILRVPVT